MEILLDVFPCTVQTPEATHTRTRVVVVDRVAHVFGMHPQRGLEELARAEVTDSVVGDHWPYRIVTPAGTWKVERGGGCGCGSPLKRALRDELLALAST